jgi:hypothetical protein
MSSVKVTMTLPKQLLLAIDTIAAANNLSRSGICATALLDWLQAKQDAEIEDYYLTRSETERVEDDEWSSAAAADAHRRWT